MTRSFPNAGASDRDPGYGWVMVGAVFLLTALSFGTLGAISVFLKPLSAEFGWSRGETAFGYTAISFSSAIFGVLWGYVSDRFGTRWFGLVAAAMMTLSLLLLSRQTSIYHFYGLYFLFGAFGNAMVSSPLFANVAFWFRRNPGLALGITASGGAFGQAVVPFVSGLVIAEHGWQTAYLLLAGGYLVIAAPAALLIRESPWREQSRTLPAGEGKRFPLSDLEVVAWISVAVIFCCNCMSVPIVHLVPLLTDAGHPLELATSVLMVLMFAGVAGRILGGRLGDTLGALPAYMLMSLGQTVSVIWFPYLESTLALYLLAVFFGFTYSGVMSSILVCTRMMVSPRFAGRAMSLTSFFGWMGMGMGGYLGGVFFDLQGDYTWAYAFAGIMGLVNVAILMLFRLRIAGQRPPRAAVPA